MEKLHQFLPSATGDFVLHTGHMPPVENPQGVAEAILKYGYLLFQKEHRPGKGKSFGEDFERLRFF